MKEKIKNTKKSKKDSGKAKKDKPQTKRFLSGLVEKAGISASLKSITLNIFKVAVVINMIISGVLIYLSSVKETYNVIYLIALVFIIWTVGFILILILLWAFFYVYIDLRIYQRRVGIEDVFPDFLQLTSANIRAGMPIDQALWHAIRPNFGVLANEMEYVAKQTMSGTPLEQGLREFSNKYESKLIRSSVSLLIEGLNAGGEIGELLDRIATNIQESKMMQKEMAASVTTYAIFITFATIVAAPFLLALSSQLLVVIQNIISSISLPETGTSMMISFSEVGVSPADFKIFAMTMLTISSTLSAAIVATITKGTVKAGLKYIPMFIFSSVILFFVLEYFLGIMLSGVF